MRYFTFITKIIFSILMFGFILLNVSSCQKYDLSLRQEIDNIKEEISNIKLLLNQLQDNKTIQYVEKIDNGYIIKFTDGTYINIYNGTNGVDAPFITKVEETVNYFIFYFSDGSQITSEKKIEKIRLINEGNYRAYIYVPGFTKESQLLWIISRSLTNGLMHPLDIKEIPNGLYDYTKGTLIIGQGGTDWISPYLVYDVNNIDGDFPSKEHEFFTGGFHGYMGLSEGVTSTAECIEVSMYGDNIFLPSDKSVDVHNAEIVWKNLVQASNTEKSNGKGRYVLEEIITCNINHTGICNIKIETLALEDIEIVKHYGLQCANSSFGGNIIYSGIEDIVYPYNTISFGPIGCKEIQFNNNIQFLNVF